MAQAPTEQEAKLYAYLHQRADLKVRGLGFRAFGFRFRVSGLGLLE